jgi:hypothetical protein
MTTTRVDLAEVRRRALGARRTGEDLSFAAGRWREALASPIPGCGPAGVAEALEGVREAWGRDFAVYAQALEEWSRAAQAAAAAYGAADEKAAAGLDAVQPSALDNGPPVIVDAAGMGPAGAPAAEVGPAGSVDRL